MSTIIGYLVFFGPFVALLLASIALIVAVRWRRIWLVIPFVALLILWAIVGPEIMAYSIGGGFGAGAMVSLLTFPADCMALVLLILGGIILFVRLERAAQWKRYLAYYLIGATLILFLPLVPVIGGGMIRNRCDKLNRDEGDTIIIALEAYKEAHGQYPQAPEQLVPEYMPALPTLHCFDKLETYNPTDFSFMEPKIELVTCTPENVTLLVIPDLAGGWPQRHNLATGKWSQISFLDGVCSHLE
jgi:hypothetical protein